MRALTLVADRKLVLADVDAPPAPGPGEVAIRVKAVGLNHIDLWGYRGMAFAKRKLPLVVGAEAAGEIAAVGEGVATLAPGDPVVMYGAITCGICKACRECRDNLCENVGGLMGFHVDGFARDIVNFPERLTIKAPPGLAMRDAACAPIAFATVEHMLFDNAKLEPGEIVLVHAGGSGIGSAAIKMAKAIGAIVITTVGDDAKAAKAKALGADHVINYRRDRFEHEVRKITAKKGVDVVFEHTGADTFAGSLLALKRGGRLVTCGATSGPMATLNLMQLFQQQYRIFGSFGASMKNIRTVLAKMARRIDAGDRYRGRSRRFRTRPRAPRNPPGVRQGHRDFLERNRIVSDSMSMNWQRWRRRMRRIAGLAVNAVAGWGVTLLLGVIQRCDRRPHQRLCRRLHAHGRAMAARAPTSAAPISRRRSPTSRLPSARKSCAACGTTSDVSPSSSPISTTSAWAKAIGAQTSTSRRMTLRASSASGTTASRH